MRRTLLIVLLSSGTVLGFAHGCADLAWHVRHYRSESVFHDRSTGHARFADRIADVCVRAARRELVGGADARSEPPLAPPGAIPPPPPGPAVAEPPPPAMEPLPPPAAPSAPPPAL